VRQWGSRTGLGGLGEPMGGDGVGGTRRRRNTLGSFAGACEKERSVHPERAAAYRRRLAVLGDEIVQLWWHRHGPDTEHGGFHGYLDRQWRPGQPTDKSSVQQARHLWALATWAERRGRTGLVDSLSRSTYEFIRRALVDRADGELHYTVTREGIPVDTTKILYAQAFGIYGLSTYGRVYGDAEAVDLARGVFRSVDARAHDTEHGGYRQDADPHWLSKGAPKETNTHIHLMEGFGALLDATGDGLVGERVAELLEVVTTKLLQPEGYVHPSFGRDWTPLGSPVISYGHDIETAWLIVDAARALGRDPQTVSPAALTMGTRAIREGFDAERGGLFDEGIPGERVTNPIKVWWAQFEALAGLWWLYRFTGDPAYLDVFDRVLDWIEGPARDPEHGEWYFSIGLGGNPDERGDHKGEVWKTTYHGLRAVLFIDDWIAAAAAEANGGPERKA